MTKNELIFIGITLANAFSIDISGMTITLERNDKKLTIDTEKVDFIEVVDQLPAVANFATYEGFQEHLSSWDWEEFPEMTRGIYEIGQILAEYNAFIWFISRVANIFWEDYRKCIKKTGWEIVEEFEKDGHQYVKIDNEYFPARISVPKEDFLGQLMVNSRDPKLCGGKEVDADGNVTNIVMYAGFNPDMSLYVLEDLINACQKEFAKKSVFYKVLLERQGPFVSSIGHHFDRKEAKSSADSLKQNV